jgi:hypothetical protein
MNGHPSELNIMKFTFFWDKTPRHWVTGFRRFEAKQWPRNFWGTVYGLSRVHVPEEPNSQLPHCEISKILDTTISILIRCTAHPLLFCTVTNKRTIISQILEDQLDRSCEK